MCREHSNTVTAVLRGYFQDVGFFFLPPHKSLKVTDHFSSVKKTTCTEERTGKSLQHQRTCSQSEACRPAASLPAARLESVLQLSAIQHYVRRLHRPASPPPRRRHRRGNGHKHKAGGRDGRSQHTAGGSERRRNRQIRTPFIQTGWVLMGAAAAPGHRCGHQFPPSGIIVGVPGRKTNRADAPEAVSDASCEPGLVRV